MFFYYLILTVLHRFNTPSNNTINITSFFTSHLQVTPLCKSSVATCIILAYSIIMQTCSVPEYSRFNFVCRLTTVDIHSIYVGSLIKPVTSTRWQKWDHYIYSGTYMGSSKPGTSIFSRRLNPPARSIKAALNQGYT